MSGHDRDCPASRRYAQANQRYRRPCHLPPCPVEHRPDPGGRRPASPGRPTPRRSGASPAGRWSRCRSWPGRSDSEIFFESLALNDVPSQRSSEGGQDMLARYIWELQEAFAARRELLTRNGRLLPGALEAAAATAGLPGVLQSVVTGSIRPNAAEKLTAFGLDGLLRPGHRRLRRRSLPQGLAAAAVGHRGPGEVPRADRGDRVPRRLQPRRRGGPDRRGPLHRHRQRPVHRHRPAGRGRGRRPDRPDRHGARSPRPSTG